MKQQSVTAGPSGFIDDSEDSPCAKAASGEFYFFGRRPNEKDYNKKSNKELRASFP